MKWLKDLFKNLFGSEPKKEKQLYSEDFAKEQLMKRLYQLRNELKNK